MGWLNVIGAKVLQLDAVFSVTLGLAALFLPHFSLTYVLVRKSSQNSIDVLKPFYFILESFHRRYPLAYQPSDRLCSVRTGIHLVATLQIPSEVHQG